MTRIRLIGGGRAGKTWLGQALAQRHGAPFVELHGLHWAPGWRAVGHEELEGRQSPG